MKFEYPSFYLGIFLLKIAVAVIKLSPTIKYWCNAPYKQYKYAGLPPENYKK